MCMDLFYEYAEERTVLEISCFFERMLLYNISNPVV